MEGKKQLIIADKDKAISTLLQFVNAYPQIVKPEIGLEAFVDDLIKAATKFAVYLRLWTPED